MASAKLNLPQWTRTHAALLDQLIMDLRSKMLHHTEREDRGTADQEDIAAAELYTGVLHTLISMRRPVGQSMPSKDEICVMCGGDMPCMSSTTVTVRLELSEISALVESLDLPIDGDTEADYYTGISPDLRSAFDALRAALNGAPHA